MGKDSNSKHHVLVVQTSHLSVGIFKKENSQVVSEYSKIMLIPLTFIVDSTINLMSGLYHECEKMKHYSLCSKNYSFRNRDNMCMSHTPLALSCLPLLLFFFFSFFGCSSCYLLLPVHTLFGLVVPLCTASLLPLFFCFLTFPIQQVSGVKEATPTKS